MPDRPSKYADEGTAAHALAALCHETKRPASTWLGEEVEGVVVTPDMLEAVTFYLDYLAPFSGDPVGSRQGLLDRLQHMPVAKALQQRQG